MLQKALVLVFVVASIASCIGCGTTASHYVYATIPAANQVKAYREDPNSGTLTEIAGSPYPAGDGANSAVLHPSGKFLYVANPGQNENDISLFLIASNGTLTEVTPRTPIGPQASQPQLLVMDPAGGYLYVMNTGSNNISVFSIDGSNGALTQLIDPLTQLPYPPTPVGLPPLNMQLTPSGNYLYVTAVGAPDGWIYGFSVSAGVLTALPFPNPISSDGINPTGLAIDPKGSFLYAANTSSNCISIFSIGASGALSELQNCALSVNVSPVSLILDPKGAYLYVANQGSGNIGVYSISSTTGYPTILTTSSNTGAFYTKGSPSFLVSDPGGEYLFVGSQGSSAGIQSFSVNGGNLTPVFTYAIGNTPSSIVVLK